MSPGSATEMQTEHTIPAQPATHWNRLKSANWQSPYQTENNRTLELNQTQFKTQTKT